MINGNLNYGEILSRQRVRRLAQLQFLKGCGGKTFKEAEW